MPETYTTQSAKKRTSPIPPRRPILTLFGQTDVYAGFSSLGLAPDDLAGDAGEVDVLHVAYAEAVRGDYITIVHGLYECFDLIGLRLRGRGGKSVGRGDTSLGDGESQGGKDQRIPFIYL